MQHLDPDRLVILALGENAADAAESDHLTDCAGCRAEIDDLRHVAGLSAETQDLRDLPPPPDRVWQAIAAEVAETRSQPTAPARIVVPLTQGVRARTVTRSTTPRWLPPLIAAVAAAVLAVVGTVSVIRVLERPAPPVAVTARAALTPLPDAPANAHGEAQVLADHELRLHLNDLPLTTGFYQIWLIDPDDLTRMVSIGMLGDSTDVLLPIGPTVDLNQYRVVDVSVEANDGDSAHSGESILRGTLTN